MAGKRKMGGPRAVSVRSRMARERKFPGVEGESATALRKATLFMNGRSQAVRLPKEFRFEGTHVYARKEGNRVILSPVDDRIETLIALMGSAPDFPDRDQRATQERPELDEFFGVSA